ncbi:MAG: hypothetical protein J7L04_04320, partial [Bacteroidales bacterium]|nr:hypothetical protein [Bacteroidales bacterium]
VLLGLIGFILIIWGAVVNQDTKSTFLGLFGGLFIWTGWIEFAYVYFANRFEVAPLMENGEVVTKPEYLIMPSSIGFWVVMMLFYLFSTKSGCRFFNWLQVKLRIRKATKLQPLTHNFAITTFVELTALLWTFYLVLLFVYDPHFIGDRHPVTYIIAFGSLLWSGYLFTKLLRIRVLGYAIRYAIPTVIIFWNFVEILGRWNLFKEIWVEPGKYTKEIVVIFIIFVGLLMFVLIDRKKGSKS